MIIDSTHEKAAFFAFKEECRLHNMCWYCLEDDDESVTIFFGDKGFSLEECRLNGFIVTGFQTPWWNALRCLLKELATK